MNTSKLIPIVIGLVVVILGISVALFQPKNIPSRKNPPETTQQTPSPTDATQPTKNPNSQPASYTLAQIGTHNSAASCWSAINGQVYNLTAWIDEHPGGEEAILSICGKDGSAAFSGQHGGNSKPAAALASFKIGSLAQ
jgi:cytochrome b involved in lipid metabolism